MSECRCGAHMEECVSCESDVCDECEVFCHNCGRGPLCQDCIRVFNKYCKPCDAKEEE